MAINKNHPFDELNGVKCAVVETGASRERLEFLKPLLEYNGYRVEVVEVQPPAPKPAEGETTPPPLPEPTYTIGVTDVRFNVINALFGRMLRTPSGHIVTPAYWHQQESVPRDDVPYFEGR